MSQLIAIGIVCTAVLLSFLHFGSEVLSTSKGGGLRIGYCDLSKDIFSGPYEEWIGCDDATEYTWKNDFDNDLCKKDNNSQYNLLISQGLCRQKIALNCRNRWDFVRIVAVS